jgi:hypothetical protein
LSKPSPVLRDNGKQWQSSLGGDYNWKNHPTHENGEHSMLIDINGAKVASTQVMLYKCRTATTYVHVRQNMVALIN